MSKMAKIKRAVAGGYIQADMTGTGDWEVGRITRFDKDYIYFTSLVDGEEAKIHRDEAYKAKESEYREFAKKQDADLAAKRYAAEEAGRKRQEEDRQKYVENNPLPSRATAHNSTCSGCGKEGVKRMANRNEQGHTHKCPHCGHTMFKGTKNLLEEYMRVYKVHDTRTATGRKCQDSDDVVAKSLRGLDIDDVYSAASNILIGSGFDPEATEAVLASRYGHLNIGMQRMNLGNRIRKAVSETGVDIHQYL